MPRGRATLKSVAERARVSRQTVSNVLNAPHLVLPETQSRVRGAIDELNYRPHRGARSLRTSRSQLIAMRLDPFRDGVNGSVLDRFLHALTESAEGHGYRVLLFTAADDGAEVAAYDELLSTHDLDAFVLTGTHHGDQRTSWLAERDIPFVTFGRPWGAASDPATEDSAARHSWVDIDGSAGTAEVTERLLAAGHRRVGFLGWPAGSGVGDDRRAGWQRAMDAAGRGGDRLTVEVPDGVRPGSVGADALLSAREPVSAIVCASDSLACGALSALAERGGVHAGRAGHRLRRHRHRRRPGADVLRPAAGRRGRAVRAAAHRPARPAARRRAAAGPRPPAAPARRPPLRRGAARMNRRHPPRLRFDPSRARRLVMPRHIRSSALAALAAGSLAALTACGGSSFDSGGTTQQSAAPGEKVSLKMLIASSGDAETKAVNAATEAWAKKTGNSVTVTPAQNIQQQLGQAFAGGQPPDVFYVDAAKIGDYAKVNALYPYGDQVDPQGFVPALTQTFTVDDKLMCAPKDFSTLALEINTAAWKKAGLTDADVPTTWEQLQQVAQKLTSGKQTGLVIGPTRDRVDAFMLQAGGYVVNDDGTKVTADSPENVKALDYVKQLLTAGVLKYPQGVGAGWGGEAFGKEAAAMTIEGNWIKGALKNDFPDVKYQVAELPAGPAGKGTLLFTQCWGIAQKSAHQAAAVDLVKFLTSPEQQLEAAAAFGVMPSRTDALQQYEQKYPEDKAFAAGAEYGRGPANAAGLTPVLDAFDSDLAQLATKDPAQMLQTLQKNASAALGG